MTKRIAGAVKGRPFALNADQIKHAHDLRQSELSYREIGERLDVPHVTAWRAINEFDYGGRAIPATSASSTLAKANTP